MLQASFIPPPLVNQKRTTISVLSSEVMDFERAKICSSVLELLTLSKYFELDRAATTIPIQTLHFVLIPETMSTSHTVRSN